VSDFYLLHQALFQSTAIYIVLALSFQVVLRTGVFSFASVGFFGIGGYLGAKLALEGMPVQLALLVVVVTCAVLGYLLALPFVRLRGLYLGMVTVAFDQVVLIVANNGGRLTGGPNGLFGIPLGLSTGGLLTIAVVCVLLVSQLERRTLGRSLEAIRTDENLAKSMGFKVLHDRNFVFTLSATLGGLAGVMQATNFSFFGTPSFSFELVITGLTMAVVGGVDSWIGAIIGALFVVWFPTVATSVAGTWQQIIYGVLIIVVVTYEPGGIYGLVRRGVRAGLARRGSRGRATEAPVGSRPPDPVRQSTGQGEQVDGAAVPR
jgi:branched-chain amino acid transport system permease protein